MRAVRAALLLLALPRGEAGTAAIKRRLLAAYGDPNVRPEDHTAVDGDGTCTIPPEQVHVQFYVDRYHVLDEFTQTYGFEGFFRSWWRDPRLAFNTTANCSASSDGKIILDSAERKQIWQPDFYLEHASFFTREKKDNGMASLLEAYPDGTVWSSQQVSLKLRCQMDFASVPFDTQRCELLLGLYSQTSSEVIVTWKPARPALESTDAACLTSWVVSVRAPSSPPRARPPRAPSRLEPRRRRREPRLARPRVSTRRATAQGYTEDSVLKDYSGTRYSYAQAHIAFTRKPQSYLQARGSPHTRAQLAAPHLRPAPLGPAPPRPTTAHSRSPQPAPPPPDLLPLCDPARLPLVPRLLHQPEGHTRACDARSDHHPHRDQ